MIFPSLLAPATAPRTTVAHAAKYQPSLLRAIIPFFLDVARVFRLPPLRPCIIAWRAVSYLATTSSSSGWICDDQLVRNSPRYAMMHGRSGGERITRSQARMKGMIARRSEGWYLAA